MPVIRYLALGGFELTAADHWHPSGKMHAMWAEKALPVALKILLVDEGE